MFIEHRSFRNFSCHYTNTCDVIDNNEPPAKLFNMLKQTVINEVCSPEILPYKHSIIKHFLNQIDEV